MKEKIRRFFRRQAVGLFVRLFPSVDRNYRRQVEDDVNETVRYYCRLNHLDGMITLLPDIKRKGVRKHVLKHIRDTYDELISHPLASHFGFDLFWAPRARIIERERIRHTGSLFSLAIHDAATDLRFEHKMHELLYIHRVLEPYQRQSA